MNKEQSLVNAQVEVNRAVWAMNEDIQTIRPEALKHLSFLNREEKKQYILKCCREAIKDLQQYLKEAENDLF